MMYSIFSKLKNSYGSHEFNLRLLFLNPQDQIIHYIIIKLCISSTKKKMYIGI